jgi:osmotically-inducible protein OsmY
VKTPARALLVVSAFLVLATAPTAATVKQAPSVDDARLLAAVERELDKKDLRLVKASVTDGVVTLAGEVQHLFARRQAVTVTGKVKGVKSVVDQLTIESGMSDVALAEGVAHQVRTYSQFTVFDDINVRAKDGVVLLVGAVTTPNKSKDLEDRVSRVPGVREVRNNITVLPSSPSDDQIRYLLANALYRDLMFEQYAGMSNPPVHIIVERGHVTLTGAVGSQMEYQKAEIIARSVFGVFSVTNRLRIER